MFLEFVLHLMISGGVLSLVDGYFEKLFNSACHFSVYILMLMLVRSRCAVVESVGSEAR